MSRPACARPAATSGWISSNGSTRYGNVVAERELEDEERRRQLAGDDDLGLPELVEGQALARHDDRAVAGADRGAVRQERIALVHERVRRERHRRHLETAFERPFVQRLDVLDDRLELEALRIDGPGGEPPEHEGVVGIGAETDADHHAAGG